MKNWRTTAAGLLGILAALCTFLGYALTIPPPSLPDILIALGIMLTACAHGAGLLLAKDGNAPSTTVIADRRATPRTDEASD